MTSRDTEQPTIISKEGRLFLQILFLSAAIASLIGLFAETPYFWPSFLQNGLYATTLAAGAALFISINHIAHAGWATALRRIPEAMTTWLGYGAVALLLVFFGRDMLYGSGREELLGSGRVMALKSTYLEPTFIFIRMAVILAGWVWIAALLRRESYRQDIDGALEHTWRSRRYAGFFLVVFGLTIIGASFDWVMSLEPNFYSTIFGFYIFSGLFTSAIATITLLALLLQRRGVLPGLHDEHFHNLGKMLFAFSTFWAYIWICQYLLIYYTNLPEETIYYIHRTTSGWAPFFLGNIALNWVIPFVLLISRRAKKSRLLLGVAAFALLLGHWVDLYTMILPSTRLAPSPALVDFALAIAFPSFFFLLFDRAFRRHPSMPLNDPYLEESLWYDHELDEADRGDFAHRDPAHHAHEALSHDASSNEPTGDSPVF
jgi:hypothetical protein